MSGREESRARRIAYVIGTYPVPTTTFIDREIEAIRLLGADVRVISIRRPDEAALSERQRRMCDGVRYVLPARPADVMAAHAAFLVTRPVVYLRTLLELVSRPHPSARSRLRTALHFGLGVHVARLLRTTSPSDHLHAHFIDRAALVSLVAARLLDRPYSATAHANDIYVRPVLLPEKIRAAKFVATCTRYNREHLLTVAPPAARGKVRCLYHGLDLDEYDAGRRAEDGPPVVLAVGQLQEKKGLGVLLEACRVLADRGVAFRCQIVGAGPLRAQLARRIAQLELGTTVQLTGALPHDVVIERLRRAAVFALPCVTGPDGDRDGIPNAIVEAMAMSVPVVSTRLSGIPEAVDDGRTGLLVRPGDASALADALGRLLADEALRARLGAAGRERARRLFDVRANTRALLEEMSA